MAISRFWLVIIIGPILFLFGLLFTGNLYSLDFAVNGKKDDPLVKSEALLQNAPAWLRDTLQKAKDHRLAAHGDTLYLLENNIVKTTVGKQAADGILPTCKNTIIDLVLPLIAYLSFFCGIMQLLVDSGASEKLAKWLSPVFVKVFPDVPTGHRAISLMMLNFAANFLGLDSAATPFGLEAMKELQSLNPDKEKASNAQIMFLCLHAAGLTLVPTSIIGYRAAQNAQNPADVMLPCIITSFVGTIAALVIVGIRQKIKLRSAVLVISFGLITAIIAALLWYIARLGIIEKNLFTSNLSNILLLGIILAVLAYSFAREKHFEANGKGIFSSFIAGAYNGLKTGQTVFPYILGMLVAISLFRNSGLFELLSGLLSKGFLALGVNTQIVHALPVAMLRPFNATGSRGFLIDAMKTFGADSFTGRLSSVFQCAAETTFYVIAVYFGSINIRNTRYTLYSMLLVDFVCIIAAIFVCLLFFPLQ